MAYATQAEVEKEVGGAERLIELTDFDDTGALDAAVLADAIARADRLIDNYAVARYTVPFDPVPADIADVSAAETAYLLRKARGLVRDQDAIDHEERLIWLKDLSRGRVRIALAESPTASEHVGPAFVEPDEDRPITRSKMTGFV